MLGDVVVQGFMKVIEASWLTVLSKAVVLVTEPMVLVVVSLIIGLIVYFKKSRKEGLFFTAMILATGVLIKVAKEIFHRARPLDSLIAETSYSFPSGHATMAMVFFGMVGYLFWKKGAWSRIVLALIVLLIGLTRLYLRVHWFSDVFAGYVFGAVILGLGIWLYKKV